MSIWRSRYTYYLKDICDTFITDKKADSLENLPPKALILLVEGGKYRDRKTRLSFSFPSQGPTTKNERLPQVISQVNKRKTFAALSLSDEVFFNWADGSSIPTPSGFLPPKEVEHIFNPESSELNTVNSKLALAENSFIKAEENKNLESARLDEVISSIANESKTGGAVLAYTKVGLEIQKTTDGRHKLEYWMGVDNRGGAEGSEWVYSCLIYFLG